MILILSRLLLDLTEYSLNIKVLYIYSLISGKNRKLTITPGKVIWLCGAPGMGKSTSAQILGRDKGYVYYEADCFGLMKNPFIDLNVDNPSMAQMTQKKLKGFLALIS